MDLLQTIEKPFVLAIDIVRVLSSFEVLMVLSVLVESGESFTVQDRATTIRGLPSRRNSAFY